MGVTPASILPLTLIACLANPAGAQTLQEFQLPPSIGCLPYGITSGPDGNIWFTVGEGWPPGQHVGRITLEGEMTLYQTQGLGPDQITPGPDENVWFTEVWGNAIGRITPDGAVTHVRMPAASTYPPGIVTGSDGHLWFTVICCGTDRIGRITTDGVLTFFPLPSRDAWVSDIESGPDGALWFTEGTGNKIVRMTTKGELTEFDVPTPGSKPTYITTGPDGALWFTEQLGNKIGRITTDGVMTEFAIPTENSNPADIVTGSDGRLWFAEWKANKIACMTLDGEIIEFELPQPFRGPTGITSGLDGAIWFVETEGNSIGRLTTPDMRAPPKVSADGTLRLTGTAQSGGAYRDVLAADDGILSATLTWADPLKDLNLRVELATCGLAALCFTSSELPSGTREEVGLPVQRGRPYRIWVWNASMASESYTLEVVLR